MTSEHHKMITNKRIFITGGGGFIGSWLCYNLADSNEIIVYDNLRRDALSKRSFKGNKNIRFISGDILDKEFLKKSIPSVDIVIHLAAIAGVTSYYKIPRETMEVNMIGTYNLLEAIRDKKIERYIYFSTSEVYGSYSFRSREDGNTSQGSISDPRWTYSISKLAAEKLSYCYHMEHQLPMVSIRPFNIYGPWQVGEGAIQSFIAKAVNNTDIPITGDGSQIRAWCYIEDLLNAVVLCIEKDKTVGHTFNIGNPEATITILGLAKKIIELTNSKSKIFFKKHIGTDIELRVPDIAKAREILEYAPKVGIDEGLALTINSYKQKPW